MDFFNNSTLPTKAVSNGKKSEERKLKKNYSVQTNLGQPDKKTVSHLHQNKSRDSESEIEIIIIKEKSRNTAFSKKEKVMTPTSFSKKYVTCHNYNYSSGGSSPIDIHFEEDMLIPNFVALEEDKFLDLAFCKICKLNFKKYEESKINCRNCGFSVCRSCSTSTINENQICDACIYKIKHHNAEKQRNEKISALNEEKHKFSLILEAKKAKNAILDNDLVDIIKKTEETVCKQTEGCFKLKARLKKAEDQTMNLYKNIKIVNDEIQLKVALIEKKKEILDNLKRKMTKDRTLSNTNDQMIASLKISSRKSNDLLEISFEEEIDNEKNEKFVKSNNDSLKYSSKRSSRQEI